MAVLPAIEHALEGEIDEQEVRKAINDLRAVSCCVVILYMISKVPDSGMLLFSLPHTNLELR